MLRSLIIAPITRQKSVGFLRPPTRRLTDLYSAQGAAMDLNAKLLPTQKTIKLLIYSRGRMLMDDSPFLV